MTPLKSIQFEISGKCNALCPYCVTGKKNREKQKSGYFLSIENFKKGIDCLLNKGIIDSNTVIALYNYGEPLLNPNICGFFEFLNDNNLKYELSTNASICLSKDVIGKMSGLTQIQFSMCGFSQDSYNKIHGLSYQTVKNNVEKMVRMIHEFFQDVECILKLQMYKFNEDEFNEALNFAVKNELNVIPLHAIFADLQQQLKFIDDYTNGLSYLYDTYHIWDYLPELLSKPLLHKCIQWDSMVVDENLNVALCCMATKEMQEYKLTDVFNINEEILMSRKFNQLCNKCLTSGTCRSICLTPSYKKDIYYDDILDRYEKDDVIIIGDGILASSFRRMFTRFSDVPVISIDDINRINNNKFIILADQRWWTMIDEIKKKGLIEKKDYLVYNTYLRE